MIDDDPLDGMKVHCEIHRGRPGRQHPGHRPQLESCGLNQKVSKPLDSYANSVNIYALCEMSPLSMPCFRRPGRGFLAATLVQPEKVWYVSELARRMGVPSSSLQRELQDLTHAGILKSHRQAAWFTTKPIQTVPFFLNCAVCC